MQKYYVEVYTDGDTFWHSDPECNIFHRENGPAVECANGDKVYLINGKKHRENGPAVEWADGNKEYWLEDVKYTEEEFIKKTQPTKELTITQVEELLGHKVKIVK